MKLLSKYNKYYFIGIGGIGMSAIARYFKTKGMLVAGYDRVSSDLTKALVAEDIDIHYKDDPDRIPLPFKDTSTSVDTLVIYTPAVPESNKELSYFRECEYTVEKRAKVLGMITDDQKTIAVAGSHGKTTVSTLITHILHQGSDGGCNAFLGGISKNYDSNLLLSDKSDIMVVEADEFDRSFHHINPSFAAITAVDIDHLDIYKNKNEIEKAFSIFIDNILDDGTLLYNKGINNSIIKNRSIKKYTYSLDDHKADYFADNIMIDGSFYCFDLFMPSSTIKQVKLGIPGLLNVENAVVAAGIADCLGIKKEDIKSALATAKGVKRRFDFHIRSDHLIYIDDYAHHPEEIRYFIKSVKEMFPGKKITGIFQPHLYTRTRDLADEFAESLGMLDELIILDIYPAREKPIDNVTAEMIMNKVNIADKMLCKKQDLKNILKAKHIEVLLTLGAGDIDRLVPEVKETLVEHYF